MHEQFMQRCLQLAALGRGSTAPNPLVGSVIVSEGRIIGEGYHQVYGGPHAEVNAIMSVTDKSLLRNSTLYVNLEPCSHYGKTPPCSDLIISEEIPRVVIGSSDPNPLVAGRGIMKLKTAGVEVVPDVLSSEARELNKRFYHFHEHRRPYVVLKWAQSADGFIGRAGEKQLTVSSSESRMLVHKWRAEEQAILIGHNTALTDDPQLNVRDWTGRNPLRIVIDRDNSLPGDLKILDDGLPTFILNGEKDHVEGSRKWIRLSSFDAGSILDNLYHQGILSIMIEGGTKTLELFLRSGLWNEARVFVSKDEFNSGVKAPVLALEDSEVTRVGSDNLFLLFNSR